MTNAPAPLDPIAQLVAKYQSNGHQTTPAHPQAAQTAPMKPQSASQPQQKKGWTGFAERTLWDWLNLLGVLLVPLVLGAGTLLITAQQSAISQSQHATDLSIATNQFQEALLKTFRDDISHLVFDEQLLTAKSGDPVQIMAQSYTNDALRKLDLSRRALLVQFLSDQHLITSTSGDLPLISLVGVDLQGANLQGTDLFGANLFGANLFGANLQQTTLQQAVLQGATLEEANLDGANLQQANLFLANLQQANLDGTHLEGATLQQAVVTPEQLAKALYLKDATLPDGSPYPSSSYPIPNHQDPSP